MSRAVAFEDHYAAASLAPFVRERRISGSAAVPLFEVAQPRGDFSDPPLSDLLICVSLTSHRAVSKIGSMKLHGRSKHGQIIIVPPRLRAEFVADDPNSFLVAAVPERFAQPVLSELRPNDEAFDFDRLNSRGERNELVTLLLSRIWEEAHPEAGSSTLYVDSALITLLAEIAAASKPSARRISKNGALASWQVRRVTDYIMADLARDMTLAELAALVDLSPYHFCRAFKQSTGLPPHRWRSVQRIRRAEDLLLSTDRAVVEIALEVGYGASNRFAAAFLKLRGVSPTQLRRERRT